MSRRRIVAELSEHPVTTVPSAGSAVKDRTAESGGRPELDEAPNVRTGVQVLVAEVDLLERVGPRDQFVKAEPPALVHLEQLRYRRGGRHHPVETSLQSFLEHGQRKWTDRDADQTHRGHRRDDDRATLADRVERLSDVFPREQAHTDDGGVSPLPV